MDWHSNRLLSFRGWRHAWDSVSDTRSPLLKVYIQSFWMLKKYLDERTLYKVLFLWSLLFTEFLSLPWLWALLAHLQEKLLSSLWWTEIGVGFCRHIRKLCCYFLIYDAQRIRPRTWQRELWSFKTWSVKKFVESPCVWLCELRLGVNLLVYIWLIQYVNLGIFSWSST